LNIWKLVLIVCTSFMLTACNGEDKDEVVKKATEEAINYAKEIKGKEFVPNGEYELTSAIGGGTVWIDGYFKDNPSERVDVTIDYNYEEDRYKGSGFGYGEVVEETDLDEYINE
jgi:hypothetical protein